MDMYKDPTTVQGWIREITELVDTTRPSMKPGQAEQVMTCLRAGEWTLALEFLMDYIIDDEIIISSATYARIEALTQVLHPREGLSDVKELVLDMDE